MFMLAVQNCDLEDAAIFRRWLSRESVRFFVDGVDAVRDGANSRLIVLDLDAWLPGTVREIAAELRGGVRSPILVRATLRPDMLRQVTAIAALPGVVDVSLRRFEALEDRLASGLEFGPGTATIPVLRSVPPAVTGRRLDLLTAFLLISAARVTADKASRALAVGTGQLRAEAAHYGFPDYRRVMATLSAIHMEHWMSEIRMDAARAACRAGFSDIKAADQFLRRRFGLTVKALRYSRAGLLQQLWRWFGLG
jgi:hypothetical protein